MKKHYKEYFPTSEEDYTNIWKDATIVLDTNILLNLYRYTEDTRDNMFAIMEFYKDKLWMPYQVGLEFLNNRASTTATITEIPETMKVKLDDGKKQLLNVFNNKETSRHPYINKRDLENVYDKAMQQVKEYLEKQAEKTPDYNVSDPILDKVLELYEDKVGENFTPDELLLLYEEGERRYADNIPPGYKDEKEKRGKGRCYLFGDLLIWKQMIAYSLAENKDIIFVTEDKKEDWWDKNHGLRTPRMELLREFRNETKGHNILMYQQDSFLKASKKKANKNSVKEMKEISKDDERIARETILYHSLDDIKHNWGMRPAISNLELLHLLSTPTPLQTALEAAQKGMAHLGQFDNLASMYPANSLSAPQTPSTIDSISDFLQKLHREK